MPVLDALSFGRTIRAISRNGGERSTLGDRHHENARCLDTAYNTDVVGLVPLLFSLWLDATPPTATVAPPSAETTGAGVVLLSRRRWLAQESRLVASLHIYIRDLNLTIETHLLPHEASSAEEQTRFAQESCEPEVVMVLWFGQDDAGPVLTTLRCAPREMRVLPLPPGTADRQDLDVLAHGLALRLRSMLAVAPRGPAAEEPRPPVLRSDSRSPASGAAPSGPSRPAEGTSPPAPPLPSAEPATAIARPVRRKENLGVNASPPGPAPLVRREEIESGGVEADASVADGPIPPASLNAPGDREAAASATLVGVRALGTFATGDRARGVGAGLFVGRQGRTQAGELAVGAARLASQSGDAMSATSDLSWWILTLHAAWAARATSHAWSFEGGPLLGAARFAVDGRGTAGRTGTAWAWSVEVGLRGLVRWQLARHLAVEGTLSVVVDVPRQRFTFDGVPQADSGTVRAQSGLGLTYLF
jgi:hypothetical protein